MGSQVKALDQVGRGNKRSRGRTLSIGSADTQLPSVYNAGQGCSMAKVCTTNKNTNNIYCGESIVYRISLARWKRQRKITYGVKRIK